MYQPAEDSYFLLEILKSQLKAENKNIKILDIGSGTGILASSCLALGFKNITALDIDSETIKYLKSKFKNKIKIIKSDLFSQVNEKLNLIVFNPPYLPENKFDKKEDTTSGKKGCELIIKFLKQAKNHLKKNGKIILLFSSFSNPEKILEQARNLKYNYQLLAEKSLFFEKLFIYEFS